MSCPSFVHTPPPRQSSPSSWATPALKLRTHYVMTHDSETRSHRRQSALSIPRRTLLRHLCVACAGMITPTIPHHSSAAERSLDFPELRGLDEKPDSLPPFRNVNGVQIQEVTSGKFDTDVVAPGTQVSLKYVLRRSNGYFIDASYGFDRFETYSFRPGQGQVIKGFDIGVDGMHEGGRRRFVVPPQLGYISGTSQRDPGPIPPDFGARRSLSAHSREALIFEVAVVRVRPISSTSLSEN